MEIVNKEKAENSKKKTSIQEELNVPVMEEKEIQCCLIDHVEFEELL